MESWVVALIRVLEVRPEDLHASCESSPLPSSQRREIMITAWPAAAPWAQVFLTNRAWSLIQLLHSISGLCPRFDFSTFT